MTTQEFLEKVENIRKLGHGYMARCPAHEDHVNSLSVTEKDGKILLHCFAGCTVDAIAVALGVEVKDLFSLQIPQKKKRAKVETDESKRLVAEYVYTNEHGDPVAKKLRYEPKAFAWQRFESGDWKAGLGGVKPPLYRWPQVKDSEWVLIVEGEKDAETGAQLGLPATTSGGVNTWREDHGDLLRGKKCVILADADDPGRVHALRVAQSLWNKQSTYSAQPKIKLLELPGSKDLTEAVEKGTPAGIIFELVKEASEWKPQLGDSVLDEVCCFIRLYVAFGESEARVCTLWPAHTYAFKVAEYIPYLSIESPEKQSGKTRLLEVLAMLAREPWMTGHATPAALVRKVDSVQPTLFLDEVDTVFSGDQSDYKETMRGLLNSGFHVGGAYSACVGQGPNIDFRDFSSYCPKALAGIGQLPDTIRDRALRIEMQRATRGSVRRMRISRVKPVAQKLASKLAAWVASVEKMLASSDPQIPESLNDRLMDFCEPLLAIADVAGGGAWPTMARDALTDMCARAQRCEDSIGVELLKDIRAAFEAEDDAENGLFRAARERIASADLAKELGALEGRPWCEWRGGAPITAGSIAKLVKKYHISPVTLRLNDGRRLKGYDRRQFRDAWYRYCGDSVTGHITP